MPPVKARLRKLLLMDEHVCPWWLAYSFDNPVRGLIHRPAQLLGAHLRRGMTAVDLGCGMGHFTIAMARMVGEDGRVLAVDLQRNMLSVMARRARRAGVESRIQALCCEASKLSFDAQADFVLTFWMAHEVPDSHSLMRSIHRLLRPGGKYLLVEPRVHVPRRRYLEITQRVEEAGLIPIARPRVALSRAALFERPAQAPL